MAGGPLLYPGLVILEKACGTTCGVCEYFSSTTLYKLPLSGGIARNSLRHPGLFEDVKGQPPWEVLWMVVCLLSPGGEVEGHVLEMNLVCSVHLWPILGWKETR